MAMSIDINNNYIIDFKFNIIIEGHHIPLGYTCKCLAFEILK